MLHSAPIRGKVCAEQVINRMEDLFPDLRNTLQGFTAFMVHKTHHTGSMFLFSKVYLEEDRSGQKPPERDDIYIVTLKLKFSFVLLAAELTDFI